MVQRKDGGNGADDTPATEDPTGGPGNVDKIREILFGGQMRDYERRFDALQKQFERELARTGADFDKRLGSFESFMRKELEKLTGKLVQEKKDRVEALKGVERSLKETARQLEERLSAIEEQAMAENADLRSEIHDSKQEIVADMKALFAELTEITRSGQDELNQLKVDRSELSGLLTEMAMRVTRDFELPGD